MKIKFYGTRGSIPVCGQEFLEFGGNTTSALITRDNGRIAIIDAGTGIRQLGIDLIKEGLKQNEIFIGFTHFHWDHIQGFPFFKPAYDPERVINILAMGKERAVLDLKEVFKGQMKQEYFPIPLQSMGAQLNFVQTEQNELRINDCKISVIKQNHPGGSYGYRIDDNGKRCIYCTDLEHGDSIEPEIVEFCRGADLLVHEAQYTSEQLKLKKGWGHSSYDQAIEVAEKAGVNQLVITHHDPEHDDDFLNKMEKICQKRFPNLVFAREQMEIIV